VTLTKDEKVDLVRTYYQCYAELASCDGTKAELNLKVPRAAFADVLDEIGTLLLQRSSDLATHEGPVKEFLDTHIPPGDLLKLLPDEFRAFCLTLNALKQWLSAEQLATDRYLLGGTARQTLKEAASVCTITNKPLDLADLELHHPARDGRPPIPVSKAAHKVIENQVTVAEPRNDRTAVPADPVEMTNVVSAEQSLKVLKRSRTWSWVMLRRGCLDLLGQDAGHSTPAVGATSRTFARQAVATTGRDLRWILSFLDQSAYGL
jgi:hypothetical protein